MEPFAQAYVDTRSRIIDLTRTTDLSKWIEMSPLTPKWRVRDVVGHLCGASQDIMSNNFPTADMHAWTQAQVDRFAHVPLEEICVAWEATGIEERVTPAFGQLLFDIVTHEFDIRYALGVPGDKQSDAVSVAAEFAANMLRGTHAARVEFPSRVIAFEGEEPAITLRSSEFDYIRAATGRRSWNQVRAMEWGADPDVVRAKLYGSDFFRPQEFDVVDP